MKKGATHILFLAFVLLVIIASVLFLTNRKIKDATPSTSQNTESTLTTVFDAFAGRNSLFGISSFTASPISYTYGVAVISYSEGQELTKYIVFDFKNNVSSETSFYGGMGGEFIPVAIVDANTLVATLWNEEKIDETQVVLTDLEGNILETVRTFTGRTLHPIETDIGQEGELRLRAPEGTFTYNNVTHELVLVQ